MYCSKRSCSALGRVQLDLDGTFQADLDEEQNNSPGCVHLSCSGNSGVPVVTQRAVVALMAQARLVAGYVGSDNRPRCDIGLRRSCGSPLVGMR